MVGVWRDDAPLRPQSTHLEQVGEVAVELEREAHIHRALAVVADRQPLIGVSRQKKMVRTTCKVSFGRTR